VHCDDVVAPEHNEAWGVAGYQERIPLVVKERLGETGLVHLGLGEAVGRQLSGRYPEGDAPAVAMI